MTARKDVRAAVYVRVSTHEQRADLQHDEARRLCKRRGWRLAKTYEEPPASGAAKHLPMRATMMEDARRGRFDLVVVYSLSRLSRSLRDAVLLLGELDAQGVDFVSITEPFDSTTPSGRMLRGMVATFAAYEREILSERTKAGLAAARARGAKIGRPRVWINEPELLRLRDAGLAAYAIAKRMKTSPQTIRRNLKRLDALRPTAGPSARGVSHRRVVKRARSVARLPAIDRK